MPLTKTQKANLLGGIGNDFANALGYKGGGWRDIAEPKLETKSAAVILGEQNVPWITKRNVLTDPGLPTDPVTEEPRTAPAYASQLVEEQVPRVWAEAQLKTEKEKQDIESQQYDIRKKEMENQIMANDVVTRRKASGELMGMAYKKGLDTSTGFAFNLMSVLILDSKSNPTSILERANDVLKGNADVLKQFGMVSVVLKQKYGIDMADPEHQQQLLTPGSDFYNKAMNEYAWMEKGSVKEVKLENGNTDIYRIFGDEMRKVATIKGTGKTFAQERKEKATLEEDQAIIQKKYREPKETPEEAATKAVAVKKATSNIITPTEKRQTSKDVAEAYSKVMKNKSEPGLRGEAAFWNDHTTSGYELVFKDKEWTLQLKGGSKGFIWKNGKLTPK